MPKDEKQAAMTAEARGPKPKDVTFASRVRVGSRQENFVSTKEHWGIDVDMVARVVIVTRRNDRDMLDTSVVPFENVAFICYETEAPA